MFSVGFGIPFSTNGRIPREGLEAGLSNQGYGAVTLLVGSGSGSGSDAEVLI